MHKEKEKSPLLIDADQLGHKLGISKSCIYESVSAGRMPQGVKIGRARRWPVDEIELWIKAGCPAGETWNRIKERSRE